ncbi:helix-turn-helix domain-containing protein [Hankyongella ginsenosidimutans]|uniref:helix-turn-helix domain-containing protein n=1 Tax=Hankyongella ginsenosidimutans TaxID=1763828 RepID=UPI001CA3860D|nr:helix-turn-helix transcriptional regulator [Hankyongella ginsenosidimutans]
MRAQLGLTQTRMAEELGVSVSYLNLIERNQRPVTAQFLLRLADAYNLDIRDLMSEGAEQSLAEVLEVMTDPLFIGLDVSRQELDGFVQGEPLMARALVKLYDAYRRLRLAPSTGRALPGAASTRRPGRWRMCATSSNAAATTSPRSTCWRKPSPRTSGCPATICSPA